MKFNVAGHVYRLVVNQEPKYVGDGEWYGETDARQRTIYLHNPGQDRLEVTGHELAEAWLMHVPYPSDKEELCDFVSTVLCSTLRDLYRQGGVLSLLSLGKDNEPAGSEVTEFDLPASCGNRYCPTCDAAIASGSIRYRPEGFSQKVGAPTVMLSLPCEFCGDIKHWREFATAQGLPTGVVVEVICHGRQPEGRCDEPAY